MKKWTVEEMPSMIGKLGIVTGANSGLGYFTTLGLVKKGCKVIMACRNEKKGKEALNLIVSQVPGADLELRMLDLADLSSVRNFASEFQSDYKRLNLLINNAGVMAIPYSKTVDGFERQMAVNHLGHFALSAYLFQILQRTEESRIVSVSSMAHKIGKIDFDDFRYEKKYSRLKAYGNSKLANLYFIRELSVRIMNNGSSMIAVAAHPGYSDSELLIHGANGEARSFRENMMRWANRNVAQSTEMGVLPTLYAATASGVKNGGFYGPDGMLEIKGYPKECKISRKKIDDRAQKRLWEYSEELTGLRFNV